ncbi:MAG TPA: META domain-containing protein [Bryobacteraceae bacterium]|jgi:heat shock protein HslJ|nr:META domain-containing protein [Bryobacteraceae bacterium]
MRRLLPFLFALSVFAGAAAAEEKPITVSGTLERVMAIGGESTGWSIRLDSPLGIDDKRLDTLEIAFDNAKLEPLNNQHVRATGTLSHRQSVETGARPVLEVTSIRKAPASRSASLVGTEWVLEDLGAAGVIDHAEATLSFPEQGRVAGKASCNRFTGTAAIEGNIIKFGPLATTRMMCPEALMNQETKYLKALESAERFERQGSTLLLYSKDLAKPLQFKAR